MLSLLIINPNSTAHMTKALDPLVSPLLPSDTQVAYFTGPVSSPPSINDHGTSAASLEACLPELLPLVSSYDGFLVACYSAHPLIPALRAVTEKPVLGILEASIYHALTLLKTPDRQFGIVSTGKQWEALLTEGVEELLGGRGRLGGVGTTGLAANQLHQVSSEELDEKMAEATKELLKVDSVDVVCLGCAGMVGLEDVVRNSAASVGREVIVVDGVIAGTGALIGMLRLGYTMGTANQ